MERQEEELLFLKSFLYIFKCFIVILFIRAELMPLVLVINVGIIKILINLQAIGHQMGRVKQAVIGTAHGMSRVKPAVGFLTARSRPRGLQAPNYLRS